VGDARDRVSLQELLTIRHSWREDCVIDRHPAGDHAGQPEDRGPTTVGQKAEEHLVQGIVSLEDADGTEGYGGDDEEDEEEVEDGFATPEGADETADEGRALRGGALIEI